nr:fibrillin-2-like [Salvelinus alpinus]
MTVDATGRTCIDLRTEQCYLSHEDERCGAPIPGRHRVDACCCSVGVAWGPECDECPEKGSQEYSQLCPRGPGFANRGDFINGRPFLKGIPHTFHFKPSPFPYLLYSFRSFLNDMMSVSGTSAVSRCECVNNEGSFQCVCPKDTRLRPTDPPVS